MMETLILWKELTKVIKPFYPHPKGAGRRPIGIERILRIHFLQHGFNLSDPVAKEALYDSRALRRFVGIDLGTKPVLDETTLCKFRHLMEKHNLSDPLFHRVNQYLQENGLKVSRGTIVDASIIHAPISTKNKKLETGTSPGCEPRWNISLALSSGRLGFFQSVLPGAG